ncbi:hypothetical protein [Sporosalibacterium faouarense]|uniref:hypothetical protein n=1 Tax=Sporosalibacterium faouarense TaxID=516123 RepID=UPI00192C69CC|nr:hypothetical protein [Sporosalibacterium faouarense]
MEEKKKKIVRGYYFTLVSFIILYFLGVLALNLTGVFIVTNNILLFLVVTFVYYLVVKNGLAGLTRKKLHEIDPEIKDGKTKFNEFKGKMPTSDVKWYKNGFLIYIIIIIAIVVLYAIYMK